jgi:23S rRNA (uracil1939-C5)-methyltransferase
MEELELSLTGMGFGGEAFGRDESGRMTFVPFALPGERVRVHIAQAHHNWARAHLLEVLQPSPRRITPRCKHFGVCGGCHYQHLAHSDQVDVKSEVIREQMARIGGFAEILLHPTVVSPVEWCYRNQVRFSLDPAGKLGFINATSDGVCVVEECHLPDAALLDVWKTLDVESIPGLQQVGLRLGAEENLLVVLHGQGNPDLDLHIDVPASVAWLGPGGAAVLAGEGWIEMQVDDLPFRLSAGSFFQVNDHLLSAMVREVLEAIQLAPGETVFDLYAGMGLFSAFLARAGARLVAVEENPWACADFEVNCEPFEDVSLYEASVEEALPAIPERPQVVLVDPPRAGLSRQALDQIVALAPPRLVYVSCDPATPARDGKRLAAAGFSLQHLTPIDLFPQTFHIETVSLWTPPEQAG